MEVRLYYTILVNLNLHTITNLQSSLELVFTALTLSILCKVACKYNK